MNFGIRARGIELTAALLGHVERHLRFAWKRFGQRIRHASVQLTDLNGPRGGLDKQCRVTVTLFPSGKVMVGATEADLSTAIDRAADRLERSVTRALERQARDPERRSDVVNQ
jgi:putative sigma-54 modulation protein